MSSEFPKLHNCPSCGGMGYNVVPSVNDENEPAQEFCGDCNGTGNVVELEDGTIYPAD